MKSNKYILIFGLVIFIASIFYFNLGKANFWSRSNMASVANSEVTVDINFGTEKNQTLSIIIGGDVMLDRSIRVRGERDGYGQFFDSLQEFFNRADLVVVNLEGPITSNKSKTALEDGSYSKELQFTFATTTAKVLDEVGIDVVSLANNHTSNFGKKGFDETKDWLGVGGVDYFGDPWNSSSTEAVFEINDMKIALVGYHYFSTGLANILEDIKRLDSEGYFVVVMPHWGEEYVTEHLPIMEEIAYKFVDAGADAIVGSHPHVIMDHEWIGGVPVFYSVGNLLFDQYFSVDVKKGNIIRLNIKKFGFGAKIESVDIFDVFDSPKEGIGFNEASSTIEFVK